MKVYAVIDKREPDGLDGLQLFGFCSDAEIQIKDMANDAKYFEIREFEIIE